MPPDFTLAGTVGVFDEHVRKNHGVPDEQDQGTLRSGVKIADEDDLDKVWILWQDSKKCQGYCPVPIRALEF